jgi:glycosyltransferase involved in cell wall biosynthesis
LDELLRDSKIGPKVEIVPPVPVAQVVDEIDQCDIMLQPAGSYPHTTDYAAPLKLFDYMVRGKPIVAADVPCHREIVQDGFNASLYRHGDVPHLAACVKSLVAHPEYAAAIARRTWEHSADYSYDCRAERILELVDEFWHRK